MAGQQTVRILVDFQQWAKGDLVTLSDRDAQQLIAVGMAESVGL